MARCGAAQAQLEPFGARSRAFEITGESRVMTRVRAPMPQKWAAAAVQPPIRAAGNAFWPASLHRPALRIPPPSRPNNIRRGQPSTYLVLERRHTSGKMRRGVYSGEKTKEPPGKTLTRRVCS